MVVFMKFFNERWSLLDFDEQTYYSALDIKRQICEQKGIPENDIFLICNGYIFENESKLNLNQNDSFIQCHLRVLGGKGGFGSMLRAIGAQIEKTTNREACRDLSGRRMRDVNDEKKIADWLSKKEERDAEKTRRKQERLERLQTKPKHVFEDSTTYTSQLQENMNSIDDALKKGLKSGSSEGQSTSSSGKRKTSDTTVKKSDKKKRKLWLDIDEELSSDSEDESDTRSSCSSVADSSDFSENSAKFSSRASNTAVISRNASESKSSASDSASLCGESHENTEINIADVNSHEKLEASNTKTSQDSPSSELDEQKKCFFEEQLNHDKQAEETDIQSEETKTEKNQESKIGDGNTKKYMEVELSSIEVERQSENTDSEKKKTSEGNCGDVQDKTSSNLVTSPLDLNQYNSVAELEVLGLDVLKSALMSLGLKCGGTLQQRAERLFSVKGIPRDKIDPSLFAKPGKSKEKKR